MQGTVMWFNNVKGFGFIKRDDKKPDIFVHYSAIEKQGYKTLLPDDRVEFEVEQGPKGLMAIQVRLVKGAKEL